MVSLLDRIDDWRRTTLWRPGRRRISSRRREIRFPSRWLADARRPRRSNILPPLSPAGPTAPPYPPAFKRVSERMAGFGSVRMKSHALQNRKSVVWGKGGSVRVDIGGRRIFKKKKKIT